MIKLPKAIIIRVGFRLTFSQNLLRVSGRDQLCGPIGSCSRVVDTVACALHNSDHNGVIHISHAGEPKSRSRVCVFIWKGWRARIIWPDTRGTTSGDLPPKQNKGGWSGQIKWSLIPVDFMAVTVFCLRCSFMLLDLCHDGLERCLSGTSSPWLLFWRKGKGLLFFC